MGERDARLDFDVSAVEFAAQFDAVPSGAVASGRCRAVLARLDYLQFEDLRLACEAADRWESLCVTAPLRIVGGTGSPANPLTIL